jgi:dienelactone hydrolase
MYISPPASNISSPTKALLYLTDIFGVPLPENRLLADSLASNDYLVIMPDLFAGDAIPLGSLEAGLNLTGWLTKHGPEEIDRIIGETMEYMRGELGVQRIGGLGYCFGGKYVPRWMTGESKVNLGFIAHPSSLTEEEIEGVEGGLSIAAGSKSLSLPLVPTFSCYYWYLQRTGGDRSGTFLAI